MNVTKINSTSKYQGAVEVMGKVYRRLINNDRGWCYILVKDNKVVSEWYLAKKAKKGEYHSYNIKSRFEGLTATEEMLKYYKFMRAPDYTSYYTGR